jgi:hypothetical protein
MSIKKILICYFDHGHFDFIQVWETPADLDLEDSQDLEGGVRKQTISKVEELDSLLVEEDFKEVYTIDDGMGGDFERFEGDPTDIKGWFEE